jgi:hypothetical protein
MAKREEPNRALRLTIAQLTAHFGPLGTAAIAALKDLDGERNENGELCWAWDDAFAVIGEAHARLQADRNKVTEEIAEKLGPRFRQEILELVKSEWQIREHEQSERMKRLDESLARFNGLIHSAQRANEHLIRLASQLDYAAVNELAHRKMEPPRDAPVSASQGDEVARQDPTFDAWVARAKEFESAEKLRAWVHENGSKISKSVDSSANALKPAATRWALPADVRSVRAWLRTARETTPGLSDETLYVVLILCLEQPPLWSEFVAVAKKSGK